MISLRISRDRLVQKNAIVFDLKRDIAYVRTIELDLHKESLNFGAWDSGRKP